MPWPPWAANSVTKKDSPVTTRFSPDMRPPRARAFMPTFPVMYTMAPASAHTISPGLISTWTNCRLSPVML